MDHTCLFVCVSVCLKDSAGEMVNELKTGLKQRMNSLDWMDSFTRQSAKEKVHESVSPIRTD